MLKRRQIAVRIAAAVVVLALVGIAGCHTREEDAVHRGGLTYTEDMGTSCDFNCDDLWCSMTNFPDCSSNLCVGRPDNFYCSIYCLNQNECPEGYTCTSNCLPDIVEPYCVLDDHYEHLVELQVCAE